MIPTNSKDNGCSPISSNCVVWQGPDIECIDLCKGDNVTKVVHALATELCELLERLNVESYDITCLNLSDCQPKDFKELIQTLIDRICELEGLDQSSASGEMGCPDCEVPVCSDFHYLTPQGDTATSMQLKDYVLAIGNKVCRIIDQIDTINDSLTQLGQTPADQVGSDDLTIEELKELIGDCILPETGGTIEEVLVELEHQFCEQKAALGGTADILTAINSVCTGLNNANKLYGTGKMSSIEGWFTAPQNLSQSMSNMWKTICDMRSAVVFLQSNIDLSCNAVEVVVTGTVINSNTLRLQFSGNIPGNFADAPLGSTVTIKNPGGLSQTLNNVLIKQLYFDTSLAYDITLNNNVNSADDIEISINFNVTDPVQGLNCNNLLTAFALGTDSCPTLNITPNFVDTDFSFPWVGNTTYINVQLYNSTGTSLIQSTTVQASSPQATGNFTGLTDGTDYKMRVVINGVACEFVDFTTQAYPCNVPTLSSVDISYTDITGDQDASTIQAWVAEYESYFGPITP